jgi:hypothetical protein
MSLFCDSIALAHEESQPTAADLEKPGQVTLVATRYIKMRRIEKVRPPHEIFSTSWLMSRG